MCGLSVRVSYLSSCYGLCGLRVSEVRMSNVCVCGTIISFAFLDFSEFVLRAVICGEVVFCCVVLYCIVF